MSSRLKLVGSEAWRSVTANLSTAFAATMTVLIGMFLLGLFLALGSWVVSWSDHVKGQLEVKLHFLDTAGPKKIDAVRVYLDEQVAAGRVERYQFISKAEALEIMRKRQPELTVGLTSNPLPASYTVTPATPDEVKALSKEIRTKFAAEVCKSSGNKGNEKTGVECVKDGEQTSERILQVARAIEAIFLVAVLVLLVASTLLIANTIRLSIFSRRREIEVMKLVGASNWFVRGPFMVEGLMTGAIGAIGAVLLLFIGKHFALDSIAHFRTSSDVQAMGLHLIGLTLLVVGLIVGALGSGITLHRHLRT